VTIDLEQRKLEYINAGHPSGFVFRSDKGSPEKLAVSCPPLGLFDKIELTPTSISLSPGDRLYLFTDGILGSFIGTDEAQLEQLTVFLHQHTDEGNLEQLVERNPLDGRSDDRCLVEVELKSGGANYENQTEA
jgi:sigma-B regulation protein RsbU (phosphoserine phosphatase)